MADPTYTVERTTTIAAPPEKVYAEVQDFHRWSAWSPWEDLDPTMQRSYGGPEAGSGSTYSWQGNKKAGEGSMMMTSAEPLKRVVIALEFLKPFKSSSVTTFTLVPVGEGTRVTWSMTGARTLALKVMGIFTSMDKLVGKDFEKGLAQLKTVAEGS